MKLDANKFVGGAFFIIDKTTDRIYKARKTLAAATNIWRVGYQRNPNLTIQPVADAQLFLLKRGY